jgi:hypothetical protein
LIKRIVTLTQVDDIENDSLILLAIIDGEVKPESMARVACIGTKT